GEVDIADRVVVSLGEFRRPFPRELSKDPLPLPLGDLVLAGPEPSGERHHHLVLAGPTFRLAPRAAHAGLARRAPAEGDALGFTLFAALRSGEWSGFLLVLLDVDGCGAVAARKEEEDEKARCPDELHVGDSHG